MRKRMRRSSGTLAEASVVSFWIARAACTAPVAVSKRTRAESPAMSITRPKFASTCVRMMVRAWSSAATVSCSSAAMSRVYPATSATRIAARRCLRMPLRIPLFVASLIARSPSHRGRPDHPRTTHALLLLGDPHSYRRDRLGHERSVLVADLAFGEHRVAAGLHDPRICNQRPLAHADELDAEVDRDHAYRIRMLAARRRAQGDV